ncbi:MAG: type II secretion system protein [Verrucomicrobiota bacterium]
MKRFSSLEAGRDARGFTLLEISLVIALIMGLSILIGFGYNSVSDYKKGKDAALSLQAVYAAQRAYMADNPAGNIATVSTSQLQAYLPQGWSTMPTFVGLNGEQLTLKFSVMPPVLLYGTSTYDPSPKTSDGLWDVGE